MNLKLFKDKNFSLLMAGKAVSLTGSNLQQFALSLYVLAVTGSATIFASVVAVTIFPRLLLSPVAGVFGDWFDRKKSIVTLDFITGSIIGIFAILYYVHGGLSLPMIYALVISLEMTEIFFGAAMSAVLPSIVAKEDLFQANSIRSMVTSISSMLSPVLAALLYGTFGLQIILIVNAVSFILSAISELWIEIPHKHQKPEKINLSSFKQDFMGGIRIVKNNPMISCIIGLGTILNFCLAPLFSIGILFVVREVLMGSELQYGIFSALVSGAMLITPLLCGGLTKKFRMGKLLVLSFSLVSALILLLASIPSRAFLGLFSSNWIPYGSITLITFFISMTITVVNIALGTLFDTIVPREFMGRTSTVMQLGLTVSIPIGQMLFGSALDLFIPSVPIALSGIIIFIAVQLYRNALHRADGQPVQEKGMPLEPQGINP